MITNLDPLILWLTLGTPVLLLIMLLPTLLELKKPKDAGPRPIMQCASESENESEIKTDSAMEPVEHKE